VYTVTSMYTSQGVYTNRYTQRHHIDRLKAESHQQCEQVKTYTHGQLTTITAQQATVYTAAEGQWGGSYTHSCPGTATGLSQGTRGFSREGSPRTSCVAIATQSQERGYTREQSRWNNHEKLLQNICHTVHMVTRQLTIQRYTWYTPTR